MSRRGVYAVIAGSAVVMVALVIASTGRPVEILTRPRTSDTVCAVPTVTVSPNQVTPTPTATGTNTGTVDPSPVFILLLQVLLTLAVLVVVVVIAQLLLALVRKPKITHHDEPTFEMPSVPEQLVATAAEGIR